MEKENFSAVFMFPSRLSYLDPSPQTQFVFTGSDPNFYLPAMAINLYLLVPTLGLYLLTLANKYREK